MRQLSTYEKLKVAGAAVAVVGAAAGGIAVATADAPIFNCSEQAKTAVRPDTQEQVVPVLARAMKACVDDVISSGYVNTTDDKFHMISGTIPYRNGSRAMFIMDSTVATSDPSFADHATRAEVMILNKDDRGGAGDITFYSTRSYQSRWNAPSQTFDDPSRLSMAALTTEYRTEEGPQELSTVPQDKLRDDPRNPALIECFNEQLFGEFKELLATDGGAEAAPIPAEPTLSSHCRED